MIYIIIFSSLMFVGFVIVITYLLNDNVKMYDKLYYYADKINYALDEIGKIKKELKKIGVINDKTQS